MFEQLLNDYGYLALFIGTFLEGETILVLAGLAASQGFLDFKMVVGVAFIGSYAGDQLWYFLGRLFGLKILQHRPKWQASADKALHYLHRRPDLWVLTFRFMYGLRTIMPFAIGISGYSVRRYLLLNGIGALVWAFILGGAAYYFGEVVKIVMANIKNNEYYIIAIVVIVIGGLFYYRSRKKAKKKKIHTLKPNKPTKQDES